MLDLVRCPSSCRCSFVARSCVSFLSLLPLPLAVDTLTPHFKPLRTLVVLLIHLGHNMPSENLHRGPSLLSSRLAANCSWDSHRCQYLSAFQRRSKSLKFSVFDLYGARQSPSRTRSHSIILTPTFCFFPYGTQASQNEIDYSNSGLNCK